MSEQTCKNCGKNLIKQKICLYTNLPLEKYDENNNNVITFGKHEGKSFTELSKKQITALLEQRFVGMTVLIKHPQIYCNLHKYAEQTWPDWSYHLSLLCRCRKCPKIWSCPEHGVL
jgi:hypothetical protein